MKIFGIPVPQLIAIVLVGVLIGVGASAPLLAADKAATGSSKYERPFPLPHGYYQDTDEYYVFASGGQQGGLYVYGLPSAKLLSEIPIFTEDQAWGWRAEDVEIREMLTDPETGELVRIGDTHHPAASRKDGVYDGKWIFVNDKLYARIARVDLDEFRTGQILWLPNLKGGIHGFSISPDTDLAVSSIEFEHFPEFAEAIAGDVFEIDPVKGPYIAGISGIAIADDGTMTNAWQVWGPWNTDLLRVGWGESDGWIFNTSYNTERATDTIGMFAREEDYMLIWNRKSIEDAVAAGKYITSEEAPDVPVISWADVEVYAVKVPLNPHGVDISPTGRYMFIGGKATSLVDVIDWQKAKQAIAEQRFEGEEFGVPILEANFVKAASMDLGLGPTHIEFDDRGFAYIAFFVDSDIKRIPLGEPHVSQHNMEPWTVAEVIPVHYAVGHLMVPGGDSAQPYGDYLVSMNKLAKDTFMPHGPLVAEAHEVFDISGDTSPMIDQFPLPPETHYSQAIPVALINPIGVYDLPAKQESPRVEYDYGTRTVNVFMTAVRAWFDPGTFNVPEGWTVRMKITNVEQSLDITHGLAVTGHDVSVSLDPGQVRTIEYTAGSPGVYWYYCIWFCSELHIEMRGSMIVIDESEWDSSFEWQPPA